MLPEIGHLPPGTPALLLIVGGLALVVPAAFGMIVRPPTGPGSRPATVSRVVLTEPRTVGAAPLDVAGLPLIDQALERVHRSGFGDARILQAEPNRKVIRVTSCSCAARRQSCAGTRAALEGAFREALGRNPGVAEIECHEGRCVFVVSY